MCDPMSAVMIGGSLLAGAGSLYSGFQQAAAYEDQADFAERHSVLERQAGSYERDRLRTTTERQLGRMRSQYLSAGIDPNSGSAREVIEDSAREAALDEEAVLFGATMRSDNQRFTARLARSNAGAARVGAVFDAASSVIGGITSAGTFQANRTTISNPYSAGTVGTGNLYAPRGLGTGGRF